MKSSSTISRPRVLDPDRAGPLFRSVSTGALLFTLALTLGCFRPSRDTRVLRDGLLEAAGQGWDAEIELGVGALTFGLVRSGAVFFDLPPEAKTVMRSVRGADVGIYRYCGVQPPVVGPRFLRAADESLGERGWERMVGVLDGAEAVAVYVPREIESVRTLEVCVVVLNESELVIVSARGNPEPLIALAFEQAHQGIDLASAE